MTLQYGQGGINLLSARPIALETESTDDVDILLGVLTADGQTMNVRIVGTGSAAADPVSNNYVQSAIAAFTRDGGSGDVPIGTSPFLDANGPVTNGALIVNDTNGTTECVLRLTPGTAELYNHRYLIQTTIF